MLSLGATVISKIESGAPTFWVVKLYYNDDTTSTNFIGVSDIDRTIGGVQYHGGAQWGTLTQDADEFTFAVAPARLSITINNTNKAFAGKRFTDLYSTLNFDNRLWELFFGAGKEGDETLSTDSIGKGRISGDYDSDDLSVTLDLLDLTTDFSTSIPTNTQASGTNVPAGSIGRPIPMAYGDFDETDTETVSNLSSANPTGRFPALISDSRDIDAKPDSVALHTLRTENVYVPQADFWGKINNVTAATAATPIITFSGSRNDVFIPILFQDTADGVGSDLDNIIDENSSTTGVLQSKADGTKATYNFYFDPAEVPGTITSSDFYIRITAIDNGGGDGVDIDGTYTNAAGTVTAFSTAAQTNTDDVDASLSSGVALKVPDETAKVTIEITNGAAAATQVSITVSSLIFDLVLETQESFTRNITSSKFTRTHDGTVTERRAYTTIGVPRTYEVRVNKPITETLIHLWDQSIFDQGEYVYYSGKGRKYGAFIDNDSRNQGFDEGDLISNPVFIVEDMLRTELSKVTADIRIAAFDAAGTTTSGDLESTFGLDNASILFAFSQYKVTDPITFARKIGAQSATFFFVGGDGKFTCKTRKRAADYATADVDLVIHYNDITVVEARRTPVNQVRNRITTSFGFDYVKEKVETIDTASNDTTSQGATVNGINATLALEMDLDLTLDQPTSAGYSDGLLDLFKDRKIMITFETHLGTAQALEIGDIVPFIEWPSAYKVYNNTISATADFFMVMGVDKMGPGTTRLKVMEVS